MGSIRVIKKKNGEESFHATIRLKGIIERRTLRTRSLAKDWVQKIEAAIKDGRYKDRTSSKKQRVSDLIERFIAQMPKDYKYFHQRVQLLSLWEVELGHLMLYDLSPSHIAAVRDKLLQGITIKKKRRTPSTVNRYLAAFSKAINLAIKEWGWLEINPMTKISKPSENPGRTRLLQPDEKDRLLEACRRSANRFLFPIVSIALITGMRSGEILNLKWQDIHFAQKTITLHRTKNGDRRIVPLTLEVIDILKKSPNYPSQSFEFVFNSPKACGKNRPISIRKAFANALLKADIKDFRFHDLRHAAASYLALNGATQGELMAILGHRSPQMTYKYAKAFEFRLRNVMEKNSKQIINSSQSTEEDVIQIANM